jgi:hypothetical protein
MFASPFLPPTACIPREPPRRLAGEYLILFNSIQLELYCPCSSIVLYLMATRAAFEQANRAGDAPRDEQPDRTFGTNAYR